MTPELWDRVAEYGESHRTPVNRFLHILGIPLLGIGSLGLLCQLAVPVGAGTAALEPNAGQLALLVALGWYLYFGRWSALPAFLLVVLCYAVGSVLSAWLLVGLWLTGALLHVVGHFGFEGQDAGHLPRPPVDPGGPDLAAGPADRHITG